MTIFGWSQPGSNRRPRACKRSPPRRALRGAPDFRASIGRLVRRAGPLRRSQRVRVSVVCHGRAATRPVWSFCSGVSRSLSSRRTSVRSHTLWPPPMRSATPSPSVPVRPLLSLGADRPRSGVARACRAERLGVLGGGSDEDSVGLGAGGQSYGPRAVSASWPSRAWRLGPARTAGVVSISTAVTMSLLRAEPAEPPSPVLGWSGGWQPPEHRGEPAIAPDGLGYLNCRLTDTS